MSAHRRASAVVALAVCAALVGAPAAGAQDKAAAPPDTAGLTDTTFAAATVKPAVPVRAFPFDLKKVRLLDGPFKTAMDRDLAYMKSLDADRLLHMFRVTAGLPSEAEAYGGWEKADVELRGHSTGHFLSAAALMYASTGDAEIKAKADAVVAGLAECQKALGTSGYLSAFPETFFDRVESVRTVWAPFYTIHKIMAGLVDMAEHCGNRQALDVVEGLARWVKSRTDRSDPAHMERVLNFTEQGGMNEVLANLYAITGKAEYLATARRFDERHYTEPLTHGLDKMKGEHVNSFIPNIIGSAREYEMTNDPTLRQLVTFFWNEVTGARSFVTGGTSDNEAWESDPYQLYEELGANSHESCCTYNMLKLTRHLFSWEASAGYFDYYERALWNGILSTQNPSDGMMMYYVPMKPGMYRTFMKPLDSFWCCTGTGMENHAKYGDSIYFHDGTGVFVNLFIASELDWTEKGVRIRQETRFPDEAMTTITVGAAKPVRLALRIRVPAWAAGPCVVRLNGKAIEVTSSPSSYLTIDREWKGGERLEIDLPMALRLESLPDRPDIAAFVYGPIVLAGALGGGDKLTEDMVYGKYGPEGEPVRVPYFDVKPTDPLDTWIKSVAGMPLTFRTSYAGKPEDVTLVPFYKLFGERYAIFWQIGAPTQRTER
jgi:uncharacterized protein